MSAGIKPLDMLTTDAKRAHWANQGLPTDPLSVENGAIMTSASRWSLMIDPQLQGIRWIINREEPAGLVIIQQSQHKYIDKVIYCIEAGLPLLLEVQGLEGGVWHWCPGLCAAQGKQTWCNGRMHHWSVP
jgi:dynein heavy chain, axonemal